MWEDALPSELPGKTKNTGVGSLAFLQESPNPGIKPRSPALWVDSSPSEPPGKPSLRSVVLKVWSLDQQYLPHWELVPNADSGPIPDVLSLKLCVCVCVCVILCMSYGVG